MRKKLRLLLFERCNRTCEGCCNNDWDLDKLPVVQSYKDYDLIMLTGGEPMLNPMLIMTVCNEIREQTTAPIYLYTAKSKRALDIVAILHWIDGLTLTLHEPYDALPFGELNNTLLKMPINKSLRLNVFKGVDISHIDTSLWVIKDNIEWIENCPLPEDEDFMRLS